MEPQYNEGGRDWQNLFALIRFCYIKVLFYIFTFTGLEKIVHYTKITTLLYRGLLYPQVGYSEFKVIG